MDSGVERIKILGAEIKDKATKKIVDYLLTRKDMDEKYLNEEKNLTDMLSYIRDEAKKYAKNNMAMIEDDVVYGWAIHYFDEYNEDLKISDSKPVTTNNKNKVKPRKKTWVPEGQLSLFEM